MRGFRLFIRGLLLILRDLARKVLMRPFDTSQTTLLRIAAFLVDALGLALILMLPASLVSYALAWIGGCVKAISIVWAFAVSVLVIGMIIRDGFRGPPLRQQLLRPRLPTPPGEGVGSGS